MCLRVPHQTKATRGVYRDPETGADVFIETARQLKNGCHKQNCRTIKYSAADTHTRALVVIRWRGVGKST